MFVEVGCEVQAEGFLVGDVTLGDDEINNDKGDTADTPDEEDYPEEFFPGVVGDYAH